MALVIQSKRNGDTKKTYLNAVNINEMVLYEPNLASAFLTTSFSKEKSPPTETKWSLTSAAEFIEKAVSAV